MKKKLPTLLALSALFLTDANAMVKLGFGFDQGLGLAVQYENINTFVGNDGIAADYILRENAVDEGIPFNWTIAGGIFVGWHNGAGLRLPLGLNMAFNAKWDAYLQLNPALDFDYGKNSNTHFIIDTAIGVRYRF